MRLGLLIRRCKTRRVSGRSACAQGCSAPARPRARRASHVPRRHQVRQEEWVRPRFPGQHTALLSDIRQTTRTLGTRYRANVVSPRITISTDVVIDATVTFGEPPCEVRTVTRREKATAMPARRCLANTPELALFLCSRRANERVLSRGACDNTRSRPGTLGVDAPDHENATTSISRRFSHIASQASGETLGAERRHHLCRCVQSAHVRAEHG